MNLTTVIILAVICLGLGVVLDNLVRLLIHKEKPSEFAQPVPAEPIPAVNTQTPVPSNPAGLEEIVRIWDESDTHALVIGVNGQLIHFAQEMSPEQRARLDPTLERFSNWLGKPLQPVAPLGIGKAEADDQAATVTSETSPAPDIPVVPIPEAPQSVKKPSLNPIEVIVKAFQSDVVKPDTAKSLAEQVDEVLQEKLTESPLRGKGIRLLDLPGKGLVVLVGLDKYDEIDAVADEEVKAILRASVDEWGRRAVSRKV